ncbi:hypothetical protein HY633_03090 [Candidatus Uhrbacteria bacterium]|nr:hypothetical protein [Candidatus Uhrbacteria bacterium]
MKTKPEEIRRFLNAYGRSEALTDRAMDTLDGVINAIEHGAIRPVTDIPADAVGADLARRTAEIKAARDRHEALNRRLWQEYGGFEIHASLGFAFGEALREALKRAIGDQYLEAFDDSLFMFLALAAIGEAKKMRELLPYVARLADHNGRRAHPATRIAAA